MTDFLFKEKSDIAEPALLCCDTLGIGYIFFPDKVNVYSALN